MNKGPENGCPEPVYPRELRASSIEQQFEGIEDWGTEGEGILIFDASSPRVLNQELKKLPKSSMRAWIQNSSQAYVRRVSSEAIARAFEINPEE